jgi:putative ABC transport system permease protein
MYGTDSYAMDLLLLSDYNRICNTNLSLTKGEVLIASNKAIDFGDSIQLDGTEFMIHETLAFPDFIQAFARGYGVVVILPEYSDLERIQAKVNDVPNRAGTRNIMYYYEHDAKGQHLEDYYSTMRADLLKTVERLAEVSSIDSSRSDFYQIYGSILFVGIFFVTQFLIAAVLIIYYKQITEGFDDHDRFQIMQNVGMSDQEVRATINKQVLMVFFLPLGMAFLHIVVAFPVLCKLLLAFQMTNEKLFLLCTIGVVTVFALFYFVVYHVTARTYFRIVQAK